MRRARHKAVHNLMHDAVHSPGLAMPLWPARIGVVLVSVVLIACAAACRQPAATSQPSSAMSLDDVARSYVQLVLAVGQHDPAYVDAFYGPPEWQHEAQARKRPLADIAGDAARLIGALRERPAASDDMTRLRQEYLDRQLMALQTRVEMLSGRKLSFDDESRALYDAVAPQHPDEYFQATLDELSKHLPGRGALLARYDRYRDGFVIPRERLATVFDLAIQECRRRTLLQTPLPEGERFTVEYVTDKSWSGYNWYKGNYTSLIQVNTDLPIYIDRAIDLACHEGYPGHHVYNALLEQTLVKERGWVEMTVYPLFSPQSLIAEGSANYGIDVAFPGTERVEFERRVLFPAAGLDPAGASEYYQIQSLTDRLSYAGNEAARRYLNGQIDRDAAAVWLSRFALMSPPRAQQRTRFMDDYRSYVINYNLGKDLVRAYVERRSPDNAPGTRWKPFLDLLRSPRLPSGLQ